MAVRLAAAGWREFAQPYFPPHSSLFLSLFLPLLSNSNFSSFLFFSYIVGGSTRDIWATIAVVVNKRILLVPKCSRARNVQMSATMTGGIFFAGKLVYLVYLATKMRSQGRMQSRGQRIPSEKRQVLTLLIAKRLFRQSTGSTV